MADHSSRDQESMYCHACHHQWQREDENIECPACVSASTEIITPENDPRHFHNRQQETAPNPSAGAAQGAPEPSQAQGSNAASAHSMATPEASGGDTRNPGGATDQANGGTRHSDNEPRVAFRFAAADVPQVTFFTFVTGGIPQRLPTQTPPPQTPPTQTPPTHAPPPVTFFGMQFFPPFVVFPPVPPPTVSGSPPAEADHNTQQHQHADGQQQQPQPQPAQAGPQPANTPPHAAFPAGLLATILTSLFNPSNAVFGDAVYTQEALDRIITQLREQTQPGGAPPASQAALDRLQTNMKELDEQMLGVHSPEGKSTCVICVDDMSVGDKAAVLPCNHFFHGDCVTPWLKQHNTCPVCRRCVEIEGEEAKAGKGVDVGATPHAHHGQELRAETADGVDWS